MLHDLISNVSVSKTLAAATYTSDQNSASIDLQLFNSAVLGCIVGVSGDTLSGSVKIELELEHSDDNSTWSDCADADLSTAVSGTNTGCAAVIDDGAEDDVVVKVGYKGQKRYVRMVANFTGTHTNGCPLAMFALRGHAEHKPV
jgi:hypothetical protein